MGLRLQWGTGWERTTTKTASPRGNHTVATASARGGMNCASLGDWMGENYTKTASPEGNPIARDDQHCRRLNTAMLERHETRPCRRLKHCMPSPTARSGLHLQGPTNDITGPYARAEATADPTRAETPIAAFNCRRTAFRQWMAKTVSRET